MTTNCVVKTSPWSISAVRKGCLARKASTSKSVWELSTNGRSACGWKRNAICTAHMIPATPRSTETRKPYLRASMMIQVLQEDCGVHYNMARVRNIDFTKSQDLFLHGLVGRENGGTCVSMPVLYTSIARRLGYPIYLVTTKAHVFCRWDDGKERFNIEGSGSGFSAFDDDYYTNWPRPISKNELKAGHYLKSLSPGEELAVFLSARGHCLEDNKRIAEARVCYAQALQRCPNHPDYSSFLVASLGLQQYPDFYVPPRRPPPERSTAPTSAYNPFAYSNPNGNPGMDGRSQPRCLNRITHSNLTPLQWALPTDIGIQALG